MELDSRWDSVSAGKASEVKLSQMDLIVNTLASMRQKIAADCETQAQLAHQQT